MSGIVRNEWGQLGTPQTPGWNNLSINIHFWGKRTLCILGRNLEADLRMSSETEKPQGLQFANESKQWHASITKSKFWAHFNL